MSFKKCCPRKFAASDVGDRQPASAAAARPCMETLVRLTSGVAGGDAGHPQVWHLVGEGWVASVLLVPRIGGESDPHGVGQVDRGRVRDGLPPSACLWGIFLRWVLCVYGGCWPNTYILNMGVLT